MVGSLELAHCCPYETEGKPREWYLGRNDDHDRCGMVREEEPGYRRLEERGRRCLLLVTEEELRKGVVDADFADFADAVGEVEEVHVLAADDIAAVAVVAAAFDVKYLHMNPVELFCCLRVRYPPSMTS